MTSPPDATAATFQTLTIVGVGLIGGSLAAAAKKRGVAGRIIGVGRNPDKLAGAVRQGLIDDATADLQGAARQSDLIVFCTPVDRVVAGVREAAQACRCPTLITDAGSTKLDICEGLQSGLPAGVEFIGSHPLAGSEKSGYEFADADLFVDRVCVLTPQAGASEWGLRRLRQFWQGMEARLVEMTAAAHDRAVAETSHFPHIVASALAGMLSPEHQPLAARGFKDTTRIAASDPDLWWSILQANAGPVEECLGRYVGILEEYRRALHQGDAETLKRLWAQGKEIRESLSG